MTLRVACSALGKRIYAGHPTKDGTRFREPRHDVTSDVLKAVIDKIKIGNEVEVSDGESIVARIAVLPPVTTPARAEAQDEGAAGEPNALPIDLAPRDGTILRLRVRYKAGVGVWTPLEDAEESWTIGFNSLDNTSEDRWQFVGWDWSQDYLLEAPGGEVIGWLPFHGEQAHPSPTPAADADRVRSVACLTRYSPLSTGNNKAMMQEDEAGLYVLRKQALAALKSTAAKEGGE